MVHSWKLPSWSLTQDYDGSGTQMWLNREHIFIRHLLADLLATLPCLLCDVQNADTLPVQMVPGGAQPVEANNVKLQEETPGFSLESMTLRS